MVEMVRVRVANNEDGTFSVERLVRNEWLPVNDEDGNPVRTYSRDEAVALLGKYSS
jgi:hypothetical protein